MAWDLSEAKAGASIGKSDSALILRVCDLSSRNTVIFRTGGSRKGLITVSIETNGVGNRAHCMPLNLREP